jgi:surfeit locus 1 family protein
MSGSKSGFSFHPEWRITLLSLVLIPLMIGLGFWQLQRADEKTALSAAYERQKQQGPALLSTLWSKPPTALAYLPVQLSGTFLQDEYMLLDNRMQGGQFGYEVLAILRLDNGEGVLVNRGWIAGDSARQSLPLVPKVIGEVTITGHVYVAPGAPYLLAEQQIEAAWPKRIQALEMDKLGKPISTLLGARVFPYPVRIDASQRGALSVDWKIVNVSPQKHHGYAVQWFIMAAVLFVFYLVQSSNLLQLIKGLGRAQD